MTLRLEHLGGRITIAATLTPLLVLVMSGRMMNLRNVTFPTQPDARPDIKVMLETVDEFDINEGPLPEQLATLLNHRQLQYVYIYRDLNSVKGNRLRGRLSLGAALQRVLEGTGCFYETFERNLAVSCRATSELTRGADQGRSVAARDFRAKRESTR
jgi:hypothetical protein